MTRLLSLAVLCACLLTAGNAFARPQTTPPQQPQDTAQPPAPIVRSKPIILKPKPVPAASGSTGTTAPVNPPAQATPRPVRPAPSTTGAPSSRSAQPAQATPRPVFPVTGAAGSTGAADGSIAAPRPAPKPKPRPAAPADGILRIEGAAPTTTAPKATTLSAPKTSAAPKPANPQPTVPTRQQPSGTAAVTFNRTTIVLDPSHGAVDSGSRITDSLLEKDVDLAFAFKLRSLLAARGFTVQLTREADAATPPDSGTPLTLDDRAGIANHFHPVACLLIHSTGAGKGVHLYSSELAPTTLQPAVVPWLSAQASWINASRALQKELGTALTRAEVPLVMSRASVRPLDSLTCPALILELAPNSGDKESVNDGSYQQRVANAIASAMVFWQNQAQPPDRQLPTPPASSTTSSPTPSAPATSSIPGVQP